MKGKNSLGVSGTVSALLTVLLLVSGFAVSTGLLSAVYSSQAEALRRAVNIGEAVSERLQAFVYEDVRTNRTLLTVRNVGSVGSEVEYLMAVGYDGGVLGEVRLGETLRLGTQQALTLPLADLLGPEFNNYTEVRSRMATLYLKTVKGGVFGSGYMAPPSVMTAAYATSTTTISTTETSTSNLGIETGTETITTWTATVILNNPDHWPVEAYVGVAFPRNPSMDGFPGWGFQPGLTALPPSGPAREVSPSDIKLPTTVTCWSGGYRVIDGSHVVGGWESWSGAPIVKYSRLGPTYIRLNVIDRVPVGSFDLCGSNPEQFIPQGVMPRIAETSYLGTSTSSTVYSYRTTTTYTTTSTSTRYTTATYTYTRTITTRFTAVTTSYTTITDYFPTTTDIADMQYATFPNRIAHTKYQCGNYPYAGWRTCPISSGTFYAITTTTYYRLAYIKAVNLWNTTEVLAYVPGNSTNTVYIRADRPIGLAAVYVYDSTEVRIPPPPPPPPPPPCYEVESAAICPAKGYGTAVTGQVLTEVHRCGGGDGRVTVIVRCADPNDQKCGAWVAPGPGNYGENSIPKCPGSGGVYTCNVPAGGTVIAGQTQQPGQQQ
jgi:hypothetical protein